MKRRLDRLPILSNDGVVEAQNSKTKQYINMNSNPWEKNKLLVVHFYTMTSVNSAWTITRIKIRIVPE